MSAPIVLDQQCPQGTYSLSLGESAERAVALGLMKLDLESPDGPGQHLRNVKLNGNEVGSLAAKGWPEKLPSLGLLEADFTRLPSLAAQQVLDFKKVASLEREFQKDTTTDLTKMKTLLTVAPYSYLYAAQIAKLLRCMGTGDVLVRAACVLFTRCIDLEDGGYDTILQAMPERDQYFVRITLGMTGCFKGSNPTGHYELNLSIAAQRMLAVRLKDAALDEGRALTWRNVLCAPAPNLCHELVCTSLHGVRNHVMESSAERHIRVQVRAHDRDHALLQSGGPTQRLGQCCPAVWRADSRLFVSSAAPRRRDHHH